MAKIKFGAMMVDASGKLGGQVFSKNRGGAYIRTKSTPLNPQTSAQMAIRGIFASISSAWSGLSEASRQSFNNLVSSYARTDIFGDLRNPSGKNLFQRLNQNLEISGQAQITVCGQPQEVPFANLSEVALNDAAAQINLTYDGVTSGSKVVVWATPPLSAGTSFVKNKLRQIAVLDGQPGDTQNVGAAYIAKFGAFEDGSNIYFGVRVINANGQASPLETIKAVSV